MYHWRVLAGICGCHFLKNVPMLSSMSESEIFGVVVVIGAREK